MEWTPSRIMNWAAKNGPFTGKLAQPHHGDQAPPPARLSKRPGHHASDRPYGSERVEKACGRALTIKAYSYKNVKSILKNGLDQQPCS